MPALQSFASPQTRRVEPAAIAGSTLWISTLRISPPLGGPAEAYASSRSSTRAGGEVASIAVRSSVTT